jgi:hypothetical protein
VLVQVHADPVMVADLGPAQAREERFSLVRVRAFVVERDAVVDPPSVIEGVQRIPRRGFIGIEMLPCSTILRTNGTAWSSVMTTNGSVRSPRSRRATTQRRLPVCCSAATRWRAAASRLCSSCSAYGRWGCQTVRLAAD